MGSQLTKPSDQEEQRPCFVSDENRSTDAVAKDDASTDDWFDTDDDAYEFPQVSTITPQSRDHEEQPPRFESDDGTHRSTAVAKDTKDAMDATDATDAKDAKDATDANDDSSDTNSDESSHGCDQEGLNVEDDVTEDSPCIPKPGDDMDPRNPEFWRKQIKAYRDDFYLSTLRVAAECGELESWCGQFAPLTFDWTQDYDTIIKTHDLVDCAVREERSLSMTKWEYWMKVPTKRFRYLAACVEGSKYHHCDKFGWMDQIPGCPKESEPRSEVYDAIKRATRSREDVPSCR